MASQFVSLVAVVVLLYSSTPVSLAADDNSECQLPDLFTGFPSYNQTDEPVISLCEDIQRVGTCTSEFEEGSVTYNGNTTNSTAFYNVTDAYCHNSTSVRKCDAGQWVNEIFLEKVATESFMQVWNIILIVIGVVAFVIGVAVAAGLGTVLAVKTVSRVDRVLAITMVVVSVIIFLPLSGPVALITYLVLKKLGHDSKNIQMKWWYRIMAVFGIALKVISILLWLVQVGYTATQDFYGEGPLRDKNGMCVPHQANKEEMRIQDILVILSHVVSIVMAIDLHIKAFVAKHGTKKKEDTDSCPEGFEMKTKSPK